MNGWLELGVIGSLFLDYRLYGACGVDRVGADGADTTGG